MSLPVIISSTALRNDQTSVRRAADVDPVCTTENGNQSYVLFSETGYQRHLNKGKGLAA